MVEERVAGKEIHSSPSNPRFLLMRFDVEDCWGIGWRQTKWRRRRKRKKLKNIQLKTDYFIRYTDLVSLEKKNELKKRERKKKKTANTKKKTRKRKRRLFSFICVFCYLEIIWTHSESNYPFLHQKLSRSRKIEVILYYNHLPPFNPSQSLQIFRPAVRLFFFFFHLFYLIYLFIF